MAHLPLARYTGEETERATDYRGRHFWAYQGPNNIGRIVMEVDDVCTLLPYTCTGRPSLEANPLLGLWMIGNQEAPTTETPPAIPIVEYEAWPWPSAPAPAMPSVWQPIVVPASSPLWQIWSGTYSENNLGTFARVAASMNVLKNALRTAIDLLVAARIIVKG
jgi:hypothetical protein